MYLSQQLLEGKDDIFGLRVIVEFLHNDLMRQEDFGCFFGCYGCRVQGKVYISNAGIMNTPDVGLVPILIQLLTSYEKGWSLRQITYLLCYQSHFTCKMGTLELLGIYSGLKVIHLVKCLCLPHTK